MLINPYNSKLDIKIEVRTDYDYLPKFSWQLSGIEISKPALALKHLLLKPHKSSGSFKRTYVHPCNLAMFHSCQGKPCLYMPQWVFFWEPRILINMNKWRNKNNEMQHRGFSIFKYYLFHALDDDISYSHRERHTRETESYV